jgi:glutathione peroxidase
MNPLKIFAGTLFSNSKPEEELDLGSIYDININSLSGKPMRLKDFEGKYILFVNVASRCGFTPQYKELQELHETYKNTLVVVGLPCNQFGGQEPGNSKEIESFCQVNYGVKFPITEKIDVKGQNQHPLYQWLTHKTVNGVKNSSVKWNFQKYLVDTKGNFVDYFFSNTSPKSTKITKHLIN